LAPHVDDRGPILYPPKASRAMLVGQLARSSVLTSSPFEIPLPVHQSAVETYARQVVRGNARKPGDITVFHPWLPIACFQQLPLNVGRLQQDFHPIGGFRE